MSDDLEVRAKDGRKEGGLRPGGIDRPGCAARSRQTNVTLRSLRVTNQKSIVSFRWRDKGGSGWGCDALRLGVGDHAQCASHGESGRQKRPISRSFLLNNDEFHSFCFSSVVSSVIMLEIVRYRLASVSEA